MTVSLKAKSNSSALQYKFVWEKDNWKKWGTAQGLSSSSTCTWKPSESGTYTIYCDVKDVSTGKISTVTTRVVLTESWSTSAPKASPSSAIVGDTIDLAATVSGNTASLKYKFVWEKNNWAQWGTAQNLSSNSTCSWVPNEPGTYTIYCDVVDSTGKTVTKTTKVVVK